METKMDMHVVNTLDINNLKIIHKQSNKNYSSIMV